jgi:hypothetical protein
MRKSILAAAALAAVAIGASGSANAASLGGGLGGITAAAPSQLAEQVHWRPYKHFHHNQWRKHKKKRVCVYRHGHRRCWWR